MIKNMLPNKLNRHVAELVRKGMMAVVLKVLGAGLAFLLQVLIARQFGASGAGTYFFSLTLTLFFASIVRLGMDNPVTKLVATHSMENEFHKVEGVVNLAIRASLLMSVVMATIIYILAEPISDNLFRKPQLSLPLKYMALLIIPLSISMIYAKALQGLQKTSETILIQGFFIPLIACVGLYFVKPDIGILGAIIIYGVAVLLTMAFARIRWYQAERKWKHERSAYPKKILFDASLPLFGAVFIEQFIQIIPIFLLGAWATISDVGLFAIAQRTSGVVSLLLVAANVVLAPKMAELFKMKDMEALAKITRHGGLIVTGIATPVIFTFLVFPKWVMGLFGGEFVEAWILLVILSFGQLVNLMTGSVAFLLMMTGHEKLHLFINIIAAVLSVFLSISLIPFFGAMGAALSSAIPLILVNLLRTYYVKKKLGFSVLIKSRTLDC